MIKVAIFHQLMSRPRKIITPDGINGAFEDENSKITKSASKNNCSTQRTFATYKDYVYA